MKKNLKLTNGARVWVRAFGMGTVIDDYWRQRDRFRVRLDRGGDYDFGETVLTEVNATPTPAVPPQERP